MSFSVRVATLADVDAIVEIDQNSFSQPWQPQTFEASLRDAKYICLVSENEASCVVGFGVAYVVGDEGEIATLAVHEEARGQGMGEALMRALCTECLRRGARTIFLEVRAGNKAAQSLYYRLHFRAVGRRTAYYADGEDALVMKRIENISNE